MLVGGSTIRLRELFSFDWVLSSVFYDVLNTEMLSFPCIFRIATRESHYEWDLVFVAVLGDHKIALSDSLMSHVELC